MKRATLLSLVAGMVVLAPGTRAQETNLLVAPDNVVQPALTSNCSGGVVYDDGSFNTVYTLGDGDPGDSSMVMRFDLPTGTTDLDQICVCFSRNSSAPSSMDFELIVRNNNGSGGSPGTLLETIPVSVTGIPIFPSTAFFNVDVRSAGIVLPDNTVYVGAEWPGFPIFMCGDTSGTTAQRSNYGSGNQGSSWTNMNTLFATSTPPRAMGIRVDPATTTTGCTPTATSICLNNNRFRVEATFQVEGQPVGTANAVKMTDDTGYLWFFNSNNVETVVKVLTACGVNNRYWVFAGGLTNVRTVLTVTDTQTGSLKTYINPQNTTYQPIQDTNAFATCP